jgi:hypothetical protein
VLLALILTQAGRVGESVSLCLGQTPEPTPLALQGSGLGRIDVVPPDPPLPDFSDAFPLNLQRDEGPPEGWYLHLGGTSRQWLQAGYQGSFRLDAVTLHTGRECSASFLETETFRHHVCLSPRVALVSEWYLGRGVGSWFDLGVSSFQPRLGLAWYPLEGTQVMLGFDLMRFKWDWALDLLF